MTTAKFVVIRHGQTQDNIEGINTAQNDVPLTKAGENQARAAGPLIADIIFDKAYASPLQRAFNTAALALEKAGQKIAIEKHAGLLEQNDGILTGLHMNDPLVVDYFKNATFYTAPLNGESDEQFIERVRKFYNEEVLPRLERGENVVVVAHTGTVRALDKVMDVKPPAVPEGEKPKRRAIPNAGPRVHEFENGVLKNYYDIENPVTAKMAAESKAKKNQPPAP